MRSSVCATECVVAVVGDLQDLEREERIVLVATDLTNLCMFLAIPSDKLGAALHHLRE